MADTYNLYINQLTQKNRQFTTDGSHAYNLHYWGTRVTEDVNAHLSTSTLSGAGYVSPTAEVCLFTSTGASQRISIAAGCPQFKRVRIVHIVDGGSGVITNAVSATLTAGITTVTFTNAYDWAEFMWDFTNSLWNLVGYGGATIA